MPDRYSKAIVAGDACLDIHLKMEDLLADHDVTPYKLMLGGTCGSSAGILAKLGVDTAFLGTIGKDYLGSSILKKLKDFKIDTDMVIVNEELNTMHRSPRSWPSGRRLSDSSNHRHRVSTGNRTFPRRVRRTRAYPPGRSHPC
ncbi:MAG: carbohydrate kinase family protein [Erysipelotrichaceae bacterium]|nr:carbohydrate kinase family protein [Erysipelotrichaceae bacterium]